MQVSDEDLARVHRPTAWRISDHNGLLDPRMSVDDAQAARVQQADHDSLRIEQFGDVGQKPGIKDL